MPLCPLRFKSVESMAKAYCDPDQAYLVSTMTIPVHEAYDGLAPAGGPSITMGSWGAKRQHVPFVKYRTSEWMYVTAGSVTITEFTTGKSTTHSVGDIFIVPKGLKFAWDQSDDFKKHFVIGDHAEPTAPPTAVICFDRSQPCTGAAEWWFFCPGPKALASGSAVPTAASHNYITSACGQFKSGLWTCTAHATVEAEYPANEFIHLLEGSIILTVEGGEQHVFEPGDSFFIPKGLRCSWRQPTAVRKCYVVYTPVKLEPKSKL
jgi:uncharacterized cupin superfamily protein